MKYTVTAVDTRKPEVRTVLLYLQSKCLPYDKPYPVDHGHWWVVYTEDEQPIGFAGMVRSLQWCNAGYMCRAGVLATHQGKGLQKRLIQVRIAKCRKLGWEWLLTDTTDNPASSNSLISMGFKLYQPTIPWGFKNSLYWQMRVIPEVQKGAVQRPRGKKAKS